jgi:hypothetical protein
LQKNAFRSSPIRPDYTAYTEGIVSRPFEAGEERELVP